MYETDITITTKDILNTCPIDILKYAIIKAYIILVLHKTNNIYLSHYITNNNYKDISYINNNIYIKDINSSTKAHITIYNITKEELTTIISALLIDCNQNIINSYFTLNIKINNKKYLYTPYWLNENALPFKDIYNIIKYTLHTDFIDNTTNDLFKI